MIYIKQTYSEPIFICIKCYLVRVTVTACNRSCQDITLATIAGVSAYRTLVNSEHFSEMQTVCARHGKPSKAQDVLQYLTDTNDFGEERKIDYLERLHLDTGYNSYKKFEQKVRKYGLPVNPKLVDQLDNFGDYGLLSEGRLWALNQKKLNLYPDSDVMWDAFRIQEVNDVAM